MYTSLKSLYHRDTVTVVYNEVKKGGKYMKIIYHGHSCIQMTSEGGSLIIDPFLNGHTDPKDINVDVVLLTHAHNDHVGDAIEIVKRNDAILIANVEICDFFEKEGIKTFAMQPGGQKDFGFFHVKMTPAIHGSTYNDENGIHSLGVAAGLIVTMDKQRIYHAGDTALFSDMSLIKEIDVAFVPIGDVYTMGIEDALKCVELIQPKKVVPIHYNTFEVIKQDPQRFISGLKDTRGFVMEIGDELSL